MLYSKSVLWVTILRGTALHSSDDQTAQPADQYLLRAVAEELKLPLMRIARLAELSHLIKDSDQLGEQLQSIESNSELGILLVESYLMGLVLSDSQQSLDLEPVSIGSVLNDIAHQLGPIARQHNLDLEVQVDGRHQLVMANYRGLSAALLSVGSTLLTAHPTEVDKRPDPMVLAAYNYRGNLLTGVYGEQPTIKGAWQRGTGLYGRARKPLLPLNSTNGAGLFVADTIFRAMSSRLRPAQHHNKAGLAANLIFSQQLQLV